MGFFKDFLNRFKNTNSANDNSSSEETSNGGNLKCPNCKNDKWYEGPSGGLSTNIECGNCHKRYNHSPFGLDYIGDGEDSKEYERNKKIDDIVS